VSELSQLISGSYASAYDAARGAEFGRLLLDDLEQGYQDVRRTRSRAGRWHDLDAPAVVDAIATDTELATLYAQALDEHNDVIAAALVASAARVIVEKAATTRGAPGTRRALEAATVAFRRHANGRGDPQLALLHDAATEPGGPDALLTVWCEALSAEISAGL